VFLVGAGPGDPRLITVRGAELLKVADVVIYDRLIPKELLGLCREDAELIYMGKEKGDTELQDEINQLMLAKCSEGKTVVRLKGGDPYVLGRGEEECRYLIERGIQCEVVPGVSSAFAVPAYAGIPVTSRWYSPSVTVFTATMKSGDVIDPDYIPRKGTLVVMMGIHVVERLREILLKVRSPEEEVAVIQEGTTERQRVFTGKLANLDQLVRVNGVKPPAIIVVGEVVRLRDKLWRSS
jgi:uroporphyrin-III C-methyltransferase